MRLVLVVIAGVVLSTSCSRERVTPPEATTTTSAALDTEIVANDTAIERLVEARCNREQACSDLGLAPKTDLVRCVAENRTAIGELMSTAQCPNGADRAALDACINAIRDERCDAAPATSDMPLAPCRGADLCRAVRIGRVQTANGYVSGASSR